MQPGEMRHPGGIRTVILHQLRHFDAMDAGQRKVFLPMGRGDVNEAGALVGRDVIAGQQRRVVFETLAAQGVGANGAGQFFAAIDVDDVMRRDPRRRTHLRHQGQRNQQPLAGPGQRAGFHAVHPHFRVFDSRAVGEGPVGGQGPHRRGPDNDTRTLQWPGQHGKAHVHRVAGAVVVLDLGFRQRGLFDWGPHDGA